MGQSSVSNGFAETLKAPVDLIAVDKMVLEKAESINSTEKTKQVSVFFFILFYP